MLAAGGNMAYISEPLNVLHRPGVFGAEVKQWYTYIHDANEDEYLSAFRELLDFNYHLGLEIRSLRSWKDFLRMGRDFRTFLLGRMSGHRVLLKDPFAVFSTSWFAKRLGCQVVITVRHPAAFASSLKRLGWPFDFKDILGQQALMNEHLERDRIEMESIRADDIVGQAGVLWRIIYRFCDMSRKLNPEFILVRHEDLSLDPVSGYGALYNSLGIPFDEKSRNIILNSSSSENPVELSRKNTHSVQLDSRANLDHWKKRLTPDEITRIREMTEDVSHLYYSDEDWV